MLSISAFVSVPLALTVGTILTFEILAVWDGHARRREIEEWLRSRRPAGAVVPRPPLGR